ncbi:hypothetical protein [Methyloglobulus sp.]|uniref:hypothetical protein n=1 Tax=Methyloglobulus sp. TaxID=2518622 RepID=UPI003989FE8B
MARRSDCYATSTCSKRCRSTRPFLESGIYESRNGVLKGSGVTRWGATSITDYGAIRPDTHHEFL